MTEYQLILKRFVLKCMKGFFRHDILLALSVLSLGLSKSMYTSKGRRGQGKSVHHVHTVNARTRERGLKSPQIRAYILFEWSLVLLLVQFLWPCNY